VKSLSFHLHSSKKITLTVLPTQKRGFGPVQYFWRKVTQGKMFKTPALDITVLVYLLETTAGVGGELSPKITIGQ